MAISTDTQGTFRLREVFSTSFGAFRKRIVTFITLSAIAHIPFFLWHLVVTHYITLQTVAFWPWAYLLGTLVAAVLHLVCLIIAYGAIIYVVMQHLADRRVSITEALAIAAPRLLPLAIMVVVAAVLPIVDVRAFRTWVSVVYWLVMTIYFATAPICIAEQVGVGTALSRCRFLTKGYLWQVFVVILLAGIISRAINVVRLAYDWKPVVVVYGIWVVLGAFSAVMAAVLYDRLRSIKDGGHLAKVCD